MLWGKKYIELLPQTMEILETMGEQIKMARLRRRYIGPVGCRKSKYQQSNSLEYRKRQSVCCNRKLRCRSSRA